MGEQKENQWIKTIPGLKWEGLRKWLIFPGSVIADMFASAPDTKTRKLSIDKT